jgi:hypothetical protein
LHDSEINGEISWFFDGVRAVKLGDRSNGYDANAVVGSLDDAADWLRATAIRTAPFCCRTNSCGCHKRTSK